jgi:sortase A
VSSRTDLRIDTLLKATAAAAVVAGAALLAEAAWIHVKADAAQLLIDAAWRRERSLVTATTTATVIAAAPTAATAPWPWADTRPVAKLVWGVGKGAATFMVLEGSSGRNLAFGPVHDPASVAPGARGNSVIEGHRDTHFKVLRTAKLGDRISIEAVNGTETHFVVTDARVVDSRQARIILDADVARVTLVTCYPFDAVSPGGPLRWVVTADESAT